jgi:hypothetical protein
MVIIHGARIWYRYGSKHRDAAPAVIHANGSQEWWRNGEMERIV